jgi:DNA-directed RNA polymerase subunit K/omega
MVQEQFTKYEVARILGARALQIAMDAPLLIKLSEDELKVMRYDALLIAERELNEGALPISIHRPIPLKRKDKLSVVHEEAVSDDELKEKEHEVEKEIVEDAHELGFADEDESDTAVAPATTEQ